jgi:thiosulfate dehydrogenase [quinone] large subunit
MAITATRPASVHEAVAKGRAPAEYAFGIVRILLGFTFLWAFIDKLFGLGFATCRADVGGSIDFGCSSAMIQGGSPTYGFLTFGTAGSHTGGLFDWMASSSPTTIGVADVLFMAALLLIGVALTLGITMKLACWGGATLLVFMYLAGSVWPENNPFVDDHIVYAVVLIGLWLMGAGRFLGLGDRWNASRFGRYPILR